MINLFYFYFFQKDPQCEHLSLQHHMLEPIQRVPRYKLLLAGKKRNFLSHILISEKYKQFDWLAKKGCIKSLLY